MASTYQAAIVPGADKELEVNNVSVHHPEPGQISIRNHAVAIQPLDAKMLHAGYGGAGSLQYPAVLGSSGAGVVEELGTGVTGINVGDRVVFDTAAYVKPSSNRREGTWQQIVISDAKTVAKVSQLPRSPVFQALKPLQIGDVEFEQAVLIDFPLQTAVAALHLYLGAGAPGTGSAEDKVLVWGAGGAVGSYAVQYAKSVSEFHS